MDFEIKEPKEALTGPQQGKPLTSADFAENKAPEPGSGSVGEKPAKPEYTKDELNKVFDEIMFEGSYTEQVKLRDGKLVVKFKSRTAKEINAITEKLDALQANLLATISDKRSFLNLSDALIEYQGTDLTRMDPKHKEEFMDRLPAMIVFLLINALGKFDEKVYAACKEGEENF